MTCSVTSREQCDKNATRKRVGRVQTGGCHWDEDERIAHDITTGLVRSNLLRTTWHGAINHRTRYRPWLTCQFPFRSVDPDRSDHPGCPGALVPYRRRCYQMCL